MIFKGVKTMKFKTNRDSLLNVLSVAQEVITNKSPISILSNVLLQTDENRVIVKCTNSTVNALTSFVAEIEEPGEVTIFCDKLMTVVSSLPMGDVEVFSSGIEIIVQPVAKKIKFKIKTQAADKFPIIKSFVQENAIKVAGKDFKNLIHTTSFAVSTDQNRFIMTGCFICKKDNYLTMVATDTRRMSICKCVDFNENFTSVIVPKKMLTVVEKFCSDEGDILINSTDKLFMVKSGNLEIITSLFEGKYPNWEKVVQTEQDHTVSVSKKDIENAIKTAVIMSAKDSRVELVVEPEKMTVKTPESDMGSAKEEIAAVYDREPITIALNIQFLADVLRVIDSENVSIDFKVNQDNKVSGALLVRESEKKENNYIHIIMPMSV